MRAFLGVVLVALLLCFPNSREAEACSCVQPQVTAWPSGGTAPANTHVFVRFPHTNKEKIIIRLAGTKDTDGMPSSRFDAVSMSVRFVELAPTVSLPDGSSFEVVVGEGKEAQVISTFKVGGKAITKTPKQPKVAKASYIHEQAVCCMCSSGRPHVSIELAGRQEEETRHIYGIWAADKDGKVDWNQQPAAYVASWYGSLTLGDSSSCSANNYPVPDTGTIAFGVKAINKAGKRSKGRIVKLKATPKKKSRFTP